MEKIRGVCDITTRVLTWDLSWYIERPYFEQAPSKNGIKETAARAEYLKLAKAYMFGENI